MFLSFNYVISFILFAYKMQLLILLCINFIGFHESTFQSTSDRYFFQTNQKNTRGICPCSCSNGNPLTLYHCIMPKERLFYTCIMTLKDLLVQLLL